MNEITTIHLVRHGEVDNPSGELYGRQPGFHLTPLGHQMAQKVADHFRGADLRVVIASPLERACETAMPVAKQAGLPILTDERIIEAGNNFEGVNVNKNRWILASPRRPGESRIRRSLIVSRRRFAARSPWRRVGKPSWCPISFPSGRCVASLRGILSHMIRARGNVRYVR